jgi:hypothetical protein
MRTIITIALLCTLAACGGGGDDGSLHDRDTQPVHCSASAANCT